ncbi:MAG: hypothetical protein OTI36_08010 [Beijerinckiaceae bacterium]|nr:hypothetical protein [Beijerinckiaceae bacterium]
MTTITIAPHAAIDDSELTYTFARAGGPGGQNVEGIAPLNDTLTTKTAT